MAHLDKVVLEVLLMQSDPSVFEKKPVFDWNQRPVGTIASALRDPKTHDTCRIVLSLNADAQAELGTTDATLSLPARLVYGLRRDGVTLDRSLPELRKIEQLTSFLKK